MGIRLTLDRLGIAKTTFYRWYERYQTDGIDGLCDKSPKPSHIWNRISDEVRAQIVDLALDHPTLSSRELAVKFTDERGYYVSESSVYRLLKSRDLVTAPAYVVIKAAHEFKDKTVRPNQLWQTEIT